MIVALHKINTMSDSKRCECGIGKTKCRKIKYGLYEREERYLSEKAERTLEESVNRGIGLNWEWR